MEEVLVVVFEVAIHILWTECCKISMVSTWGVARIRWPETLELRSIQP